MADGTTTVTSTPDPTIQTLIYTLIRAIMQILGAFGVTWASTVSGATWEMVAGALAMIIATAWSVWQKVQQAQLNHAGSVASAAIGRPVQVVPTGTATPT